MPELAQAPTAAKPFNPIPVSASGFNPIPVSSVSPATSTSTYEPSTDHQVGQFPSRDKTALQLIPQTMQTLSDKFYEGAKQAVLGTVDTIGSLDEDPVGTLYNAAKGMISALPASLQKFTSGRKSGDASQMAEGTTDFITKAIPSLLGIEGALRNPAGVAKSAVETVAGMPGSMRLNLGPNRSEINSLSTVVKPGVKSGAPQRVAATVQPLMKQAFQEIGLDPTDISVKERAPESDLTGDLVRGTTAAKHATANIGNTSVPIAIADRMVDIAHRPIDAIVGHYSGMELPQVKQSIVTSLRSLASEYANKDSGLSRAYSGVADDVESTSGTVGELNDLKVHANKEASRLFDMSPSKEMAASATSVWAYRTLGNLIRSNLYPKLMEFGAPDLMKYGMREAQAIQARDGIYSSWAKAAGEHAPAALQGYLDYVAGGKGPGNIVTPPTLAGAVSRLVQGRQLPMQQFNNMFRDGVGSLAGFKPEVVPTAPIRTAIAQGSVPMGVGPDTSSVTGATPKPQRLLPPANIPVNVTSTVQRPSGVVHEMPPSVRGALPAARQPLLGRGSIPLPMGETSYVQGENAPTPPPTANPGYPAVGKEAGYKPDQSKVVPPPAPPPKIGYPAVGKEKGYTPTQPKTVLTPEPPPKPGYPAAGKQSGYTPTQSNVSLATAADYLAAKEAGTSIEQYLNSKPKPKTPASTGGKK